MVNATEMAKPFGKRPSKWLELSSTQGFLSTLVAIRKSDRLIESVNSVVTWMHEDVALEFARWLSTAFAIWCNDCIKELLTQDVSTLNNDDEAILHAMQVLQQRVEASKRQLENSQKQIELQSEQLKAQAPNVAFAEKNIVENLRSLKNGCIIAIDYYNIYSWARISKVFEQDKVKPTMVAAWKLSAATNAQRML